MLPDLPAVLAEQEWPFLPALLAGGLAAALAAVIVGFPVLRLRGHYLAVATLGLIFIVQSFAVNLRRAHPRRARPQRPARADQPVVGLLLDAGDALCLLARSSTPRSAAPCWPSARTSWPPPASACRVARLRIIAFALGAFFAGVAGGLWAHLVTLISPEPLHLPAGIPARRYGGAGR